MRHFTSGESIITKRASPTVSPKGLSGFVDICAIYYYYKYRDIFITIMPRKKQPKDTRSEYEIQCEAVEWFRKTFPNQVIFSCPNEAARRNWAHFSKSGATSGSPDLVVSIKDRVFFVEYKTQSGQQSDNQKAFEWKCLNLGIGYYLCRNLDDFKRAILAEWDKIQENEPPKQEIRREIRL